MLTLTRQQAREIDRRAVDEYGLPSIVLMENAGRGCAEKLFQWGLAGSVVIGCGPGNNGGDGFVIARHLDLLRGAVRVAVFAERSRYRGDAAINLTVLERSGVPITYFGPSVSYSEITRFVGQPRCIVDALLGTGFAGEVHPPLATAIDAFNAAEVPIFAVDLPSGLDADLGVPAAHTIRAQQTFTFIAAKRGFLTPGAVAFTGVVEVLDIGAPRKLVEEVLAASPGSD